MPLLPQKLSEFLFAPVPYIAGVHADHVATLNMEEFEVRCCALSVVCTR